MISPGSSVPTRRRRTALFASSATAAVVLVLLAPSFFGAGLLFHRACGTVATLGTEAIWTPAAIVNSPPNGTARGWGNGTVLGPVAGNSVVQSNGSAGLLEIDLNWTVTQLGSVWVAGAGLAESCAATNGVTVAPVTTTQFEPSCALQSAGSSSDANLTPANPVPGCPFLGTDQSARFDDTYGATCNAGTSAESPCPGQSIYVSSTYIETGVFFTTWITGYLLQIPVPGTSPTEWLPVGDPVTQTVVYHLFGPRCYLGEYVGGLPGGAEGLMSWRSSVVSGSSDTCHT